MVIQTALIKNCLQIFVHGKQVLAAVNHKIIATILKQNRLNWRVIQANQVRSVNVSYQES